MNRKLWIAGGVILVILLFFGVAVLRHTLADRSGGSKGTGEGSVSELTYCNSNGDKPCVVSFSLDADNNMLVNILLPDLSFPNFQLMIERDGLDFVYSCQRILAAPNNAYCTGAGLPPGEILHFKLVSSRDDVLLAQGDLSIIGLAFPTLEIAIQTPMDTPTALSDLTVPTPTPFDFAPPQATPPAYPNPSYPNPTFPIPTFPKPAYTNPASP
jgi:hypothetical protein